MNPEIKNLLNTVLACQGRGDLAGAETACRTILEKDAKQTDALQFLGLILEGRGEFEVAEKLMRKSLAINPAQPHVLNNLGNLLHKTGNSDDAVDALKKVTKMHPAYGEAWYNLGKILFDLKDSDGAVSALKAAVKTWTHKDPKPQTLLGNIASNQENFQEALKYFEAALKINPNYFNALHNYALTLKMLQRQEEAIKYYEKALAINPAEANLYYNMANAYIELDQIDKAFVFYEKALDIKPDFLEGHKTINEYYWRFGHKDKFLTTYISAINRVPNDLDLRFQYIDSLIGLEELDKADDEIRKVLEIEGSQSKSKFFHLQADIQTLNGNGQAALKNLEKCTELAPKEVNFYTDSAKILINMGQYNQALQHIDRAYNISPLNQQVIAYRTLCWRLLGDKKEASLNNYKEFVRGYKIKTPPGYRDLKEFNTALNLALDQFHNTKMHPSDQTLRGGTQTPAYLLDKNVKEIQELKAAFLQTIGRYVADLPDDPAHPFLGRKSENLVFAGSWSVRLKDQGFHVNHVHPDGWISSCYYVSLPQVVKTGEDKQGWIKFGESPLNLGKDEVVGKIVQPEEGLLVLFPSYMWHGTIPFSSNEPRTTLPFDAIPA